MDYTYEKLVPAHENDVMHIFNHYTQNSFAAYPEGVVPNLLFSRFLKSERPIPHTRLHRATGPWSDSACFGRTTRLRHLKKPPRSAILFGMTTRARESESPRCANWKKTRRISGIRHLLADISSENKESIEFHERNGFTRCGYFNNIGKKFGKPFSVVWMEKELK